MTETLESDTMQALPGGSDGEQRERRDKDEQTERERRISRLLWAEGLRLEDASALLWSIKRQRNWLGRCDVGGQVICQLLSLHLSCQSLPAHLNTFAPVFHVLHLYFLEAHHSFKFFHLCVCFAHLRYIAGPACRMTQGLFILWEENKKSSSQYKKTHSEKKNKF